MGKEEKGTGREEETGVGRQGGKVWGRKRIVQAGKKRQGWGDKGGRGWWGRKRMVQAGKKRQVWGDKEEERRLRDRQGRRDRGGETRRKRLVG